MQSSSGGRMRPEELKHYLKSMHSDQPVKPTTSTHINNTQPGVTGDLSPLKSKSTSAAAHTYENYGEKWDNFDVDAALHTLDDQNESKLKAQEKQKTHQATNNTMNTPKIDPKAGEWKEKGNAQFKSGNYATAIEYYTSSIETQSTSVAYANRAMAHLKLQNYDSAVKDCTAALALDENYVKAWLRRGAAQRELGFLDNAIADFEAALRLEPGNKSAMEDRLKCIEQWAQKNGAKTFSKTASVSIQVGPSTSGAAISEASDSGLLKPVSTKRVDIPTEPSKQGEHQLVKKAVVQEIEEQADQLSLPPPLPEERKEAVVEEVNLASPLKQEQVKQNPVVAPVVPVVVAPPLSASAFKAPKTGVDFERAWRGFKGNLDQQATYLRQINAQQLPNLLKQVLTPSLLVALQLTVLGPIALSEKNKNASQAAATTAAILEALPKVPRFGMNVLSLSAAQKKELSAAWDTACIDFPELNQLRPPYSI